MIGEFICVTCGQLLSELIEKYLKEVKEGKKTNKQILDDLNLKRFCCRSRVLGSIDLTNELPFTS